ncbi:MAG: WD40 repeat domain-containing protein, partial [Bacteroidota bacterium]
EEKVLAASWSPDDQWLAIGTSEGRLLIFSAAGELVLEKQVYSYLAVLAWKPGAPATLVFPSTSYQAGIVSFINDSWQDRPVAYEFGSPVRDMIWNPAGTQMAVATDDNILHLWDPESPDAPTELGLHEATISDIAWSPDGTQLVSSDHSGAISFWGEESRELQYRRSGHSDYARSVDWHPNGEIVISGGDDNQLLFWDSLGQITRRMSFSAWVMKSDFSASGQRIAIVTYDDEFMIVNTLSGERTTNNLPPGVGVGAWRGEVNTADESGGLQIGFSEDATFRLRDAGQTSSDESFAESNGDLNAGYITRLEWSNDGDFLAYGKDYELVIIDPNEITRFDLVGASIMDLSWHPGQSAELPQTNFLATVGSDNRLVIWDVPSKSVAQQVELETTSRALAWSPNGQYLAVGNDFGVLKIFDSQLSLILETTLHSDYFRSLSWSPNGRYLATANDDRTTVIFDVANNVTAAVLNGHEDWVRDVVWLDDSHLATGGDDSKTILWEWNGSSEAEKIQSLERIGGFHQAITYLPQSRGGILAVGSTESEIGLWNIEASGTARYDTTITAEHSLSGLDWHPKGNGLTYNTYGIVPLNLGWGNTIGLAYDGSNKPVRTVVISDAILGMGGSLSDYFYLPELKAQPYLYDQLAWSQDEKWLAIIQTTDTDIGGKQAEVHDIQQKEVIKSFEFEAGDPAHLLFSPNGRYLAVSPEQGSIALLSTTSIADTINLSMPGADAFVDWTWSSDSRNLAVLDRSFRVYVHDVETGNLQQLDGGPAEYDRATIAFYPANDRWIYLFTQQGIYELDRQTEEVGRRVYEPPGYVPGTSSESAPRGEWLPGGTEVLYEQANNPPQILKLAPGQEAALRATFGENTNLHAWSVAGGVMHELEPMPLGKGEYTSRELEFPRVWNLQTGEIRGRLQTARRQLIQSMVVSSDGQYLLTMGAVLEELEGKYFTSVNPYVIVWSVDGQEEVLELEVPSGVSAGFSPLDNYVYVFYDNGRIMLWPINASTIGEYFAESGKDRYLDQLFPGEDMGFVDRIIDWELESGINFQEEQNFELLHQREGARIRRNWSAYYAGQVWLEESDEAADRHFAKAASLHQELGSPSLRSHPVDTSSLVNIWFEQTYYAIQNRRLSKASEHIRSIESIEPQSLRMQMLRELLDWHRGKRQAAIISLFSLRREALVREMNNWERRDLSLNDKAVLKRYIALSTGDQDPLTPMVEPTFISTIPDGLAPSFRDSLILGYYATNLQHDGFDQGSTNRYQQFLNEAASYLDSRWAANPSDIEIAAGLRTINYKLQEVAIQKGKLTKALGYAEHNLEIATSLLDQELEPAENYQWIYMDALSEALFIRLQLDPSKAGEIREAILDVRKQYPNAEVPLYLILQQAHCELALGKTKSAYHLYYEICIEYPYDVDEILAQVKREMEPVAPDRLPEVERVFGLFKEYWEAVSTYDEGLYRLEDPETAVEPELLNANYWSAYNSGKLRFESALILESEQMMPIAKLQEEMEEFNRISAQYAHVLLIDGSWKEAPAVLGVAKEYLEQYHWPTATQAVVSLMEGDWPASQRLLRQVAELPNDGYLAEEYPSLRAYLLNLPAAITESSAYQERKTDWERILNR